MNSSTPANPQPLSLLFTKPPLELRQIIFTHLLGGRVIHLYGLASAPSHAICVDITHCGREKWSELKPEDTKIRSLSEMPDYLTWTPFTQEPYQKQCLEQNRQGKFLGFMLSCKRANIEASPILYSTNAFHVFSAPILLHFLDTIPPPALEEITHLRLSIASLELWDKCCNTLSTLKNLRTVYIEFWLQDARALGHFDEAECVAWEVLEPLSAVRNVRTRFQVKGSWSGERIKAMISCAGLETAPFGVFGGDHVFEPMVAGQEDSFEGEAVVRERSGGIRDRVNWLFRHQRN